MAQKGTDLFINTFPSAPFVNCKVDPLVVFNILDHFMRRESGERVVGTLLGVYQHDGTVEIRNSFPVPHTEEEEKDDDKGEAKLIPFHSFVYEKEKKKTLHQQILDLHQRVYPKELVVGWYSTGNENLVFRDGSSQTFSDEYEKQTPPQQSPLVLLVDTSLTDLHLSVKAFTSLKVELNHKWMGTQFLPVGLEFSTFDTEKIGLHLLTKARDSENGKTALVSDLQQLASSVGKLHQLLDNVLDYVNKVVSGEIQKPDPKVGRFLTDALAALPKIDQQSLEKMFTNSTQDLLMVVYLANLARAQLVLAEKAQKVA